MNALSPKLKHEQKTVATMISMYCTGHHSGGIPCDECEALTVYTGERLRKCPFGDDKPPCGQCSVHCYKPEMREKIRQVMRYAGPRMFRTHPGMAVRHVFDTLRARLKNRKT